ncbi:hypothetical protein MN116_001360 [Schistosoma mekongi]|uniref:Uncharacterized protein n=1 Tax=Schistosoma mekongi TaxID=38744 RepID=A0AAE2D9K1_SCHME|nr:hypothetical protein MN116_001360 [Schistosoma mekongi]
MYSSNNISCHITNSINNVPTIPSYGNVHTTQSSPKVMPRNQNKVVSTQSFQRNNWGPNKSDLGTLPWFFLKKLYKLDCNTNTDEMININDYNYNNGYDFQTPKSRNSEEICLSVNRKTQPGISAAIRSLSQNMKLSMTLSNGVMNDSNNDNNTTNENGAIHLDTAENNRDKSESNNRNKTSVVSSNFTSHNYPFIQYNRMPSITSSPIEGIESSPSKNKRCSYTLNSLNNYNHGNNIINNYNNTLTSTQPTNNDENTKSIKHIPGQMMRNDLFAMINSPTSNNNSEVFQTNINYIYTPSFNNNNKYSSLCLPTCTVDTLMKRSSSTSPYRPVANYSSPCTLSSNRKLTSNEISYYENNNHDESITPQSKYVNSKVSNNNIYRPSGNRTVTGTQTLITTITPRNLRGSLTTLSSMNTNEGRYMDKNDHLPPKPPNSKSSTYTKHSNDDINCEQCGDQQQENHEYGRTYYIARRPQIMQSTFQKYLPHEFNHNHNPQITNPNTEFTNTGIADHDTSFMDKAVNRKPNRIPNVMKLNSSLSNGPLASYKRNSVSLNSLPNDIDSLSSIIQFQYANDDNDINNNSNNFIITSGNNFDKYYPNYYPSDQSTSISQRSFHTDHSQHSQQVKHYAKYFHQHNPETFRSFSVSPEVGRKISNGSILLPCRSYNENMNTISSNSTLQPCLSSASPLKRKPYQVSFNLDRNMYIEYPHAESSTPLVQCKRVPGYISSSGATPGETNLDYKTTPKHPFSWSNENGVTTIGKSANDYNSDYMKQIIYPPTSYTSRPIKPKYYRYSSPPPQPTFNHDGDNSNVSNCAVVQASTMDSFISNGCITSNPEIRLIDTTLTSSTNFTPNSVTNSNMNKPPVFGRSLNSLKSILPKSAHRFGINSNNNSAYLNGGNSIGKQIEQHDATDTRESSAIDILNRRYSFSS